LDVEAGQSVTFGAAGYADDGHKLDAQPTAWFATPFDIAAADDKGRVTFFLAGEAKVGAVIGGKPGFAVVTVKPQRVARIDLTPPPGPIAVGDVITLPAVARTSNGDPRAAAFEWTSSAPSVATVDAAGAVTPVAPGKARISASNGGATAAADVTVVANRVTSI